MKESTTEITRPHTPSAIDSHVVSAGPSIPNCLYQYSVHSAYIRGAVLDGPKVSLLTCYGDYAYCLTPSGQPIMFIDSKAYLFDEHNKATKAPPNTRLAFAMICLLTPENRVDNKGGDTPTNLRKTFGKGKFKYDGSNNPVPFAVRGGFSSVTTTKGEMKNVQGTIFGWVVPEWMENFSGSGIRACFLSGCHVHGGEVVDYTSVRGTFVEWAISDHLRLGFPRDDKFEGMALEGPGFQRGNPSRSSDEQCAKEQNKDSCIA